MSSNETTPQQVKTELPKLTVPQLLNLCLGFLGIQFAWSLRIGLSGPVTEPLGATAIILGLMWLAGPITGIIVQPIVGAISDNIWTKMGRRIPFLLAGSFIASLGLIAFPYSEAISKNLSISWLSGLIFAAACLWIIDGCVNASQGPYRALIPDVAPPEQHALANSYLSFTIGLGSVIAFGLAPACNFTFSFLKMPYTIPITTQFIIGAVVFIVTMLWTSFTTKEPYKPKSDDVQTENPMGPVIDFLVSALIAFVVTAGLYFIQNLDLSKTDDVTKLASTFALVLSIPLLGKALMGFKSKEAYKLCAMQFLTWLGIMAMFIFFTNFVIHNVFQVPDLTTLSEVARKSYSATVAKATDVAGLGLAIFNLVCLIVAIPIGKLCTTVGKKKVHTIALLSMAIAFFGLAFFAKGQLEVFIFMGLAGIGWASTLAAPFAMLTEHIPEGTEGSAMGKFNVFIAGPQIISSVAVGMIIQNSVIPLENNMHNNHWEYAFIVSGAAVLLSALVCLLVKEKKAVKETLEAPIEEKQD